jgi:hypothetical protein
MPTTIALIPVNLDEGGLGLPSRVGHALGGRTVLSRVVARAAAVKGVDQVVLVHRSGAPVRELLSGQEAKAVVCVEVDDAVWSDPFIAMRRIARLWAARSWRGGPGGMTCYDELLPAGPLVEAMRQVGAESALLVGADWPWIDGELCGRILALHRRHPHEMPMIFSQAAPGLAGVAVVRGFLEKLAENPGSGFGPTLAYKPSSPQADPIGKDVCVQIAPAVRDCPARLIYDHPESIALMDALADRADHDDGHDADDASTLAAAVMAYLADNPPTAPQWIRLEITPRRTATGPIVPQHHVQLKRPDMNMAAARHIVEQVAAWPGCPLMIGHLGDPLLHDDFAAIVLAAKEAGVCSTAVETDLLINDDALLDLLDLPIDILTVRLNADTPATYERMMGVAAYEQVMGRIERLLNERNRRVRETGQPAGVPWIVPRLVKTHDTLADMELFFDRWTHYASHAVIEPAQPGRGADGRDLAPLSGPVPMQPPRRGPCRQIETRMTIHSDGQVAGCDQDWLGGASAGDAGDLATAWRALMRRRALHIAGRHEELALCGSCHEWHRP